MILKATDITVVRGHRAIVEKVSLDLNVGELIGLIGPNGAGKSTLLATLAGLDKPDGGEVTINGRPILQIDVKTRARTVGWLEQLGSIHWPVSVERLVMLGRLPWLTQWSGVSDTDRIAVSRALRDTDCLALRNRDAMTLSGGERARVLLARVLAAEPRLLFADEPVSSLDPGHQLQTMDALRSFTNADRATIVVLHDLSLAARYCDRLYLMHEGHIAARGTTHSVLSKQNIRSVYGVDVITGNGEVPWIVPTRRIEQSSI
ncbi:MAG: ABC transporter ATP-binding protein [Granulosicoccus sp.]